MKRHDHRGSSAATMRDVVASSLWARDLMPSQLERVTGDIEVRDIVTGQFAWERGERVEHWVGVIEGFLKVGNSSQDGKWTTYTGISAGGWFGEGSILKDEHRRYSAIAMRDSKVAYLLRAMFEWLYETSLPFNHFLVNQLSERCGQFLAMLDSDRLLGPDARTARCVAALFNPFLYPGIEQHVDISQEEVFTRTRKGGPSPGRVRRNHRYRPGRTGPVRRVARKRAADARAPGLWRSLCPSCGEGE